MEEQGHRRHHLVFIPMPQVGHLIATVELAKLLLNLPTHHFAATFLSIPPLYTSPELTAFISATSIPHLSFLHLPPVTPPASGTSRGQPNFSVMVEVYKPLLTSTLRTLLSSSPIAAVILDFFFCNMIDACHGLGIPSYVFSTSSTSFLRFLVSFATSIDPLLPDDRKAVDMEGSTIPISGFSSELPLPALPELVCFGRDERYETFLRHSRWLRNARGFISNSFDAVHQHVARTDERAQPVYNIGPLLFMGKEGDHECLRWLDRQPHGSVVFLCFGSRGSFAKAQVREVAVGLERSGHRFLWVLRSPPPEGSGDFGVRDAVLDEVLPEGFVGRTEDRGLVWPTYAPQAEVLRHPAVGGFVTHCGWNSSLEGLWFGVPMAAWPLFAEQHWNAHEMVREIGVAVEVKGERRRGNWVEAAEVERAVRVLMGEEGEAVRRKGREMMEEARRAVTEGGSSYRALRSVATEFVGGDRSQSQLRGAFASTDHLH